jgi:MFS family permease
MHESSKTLENRSNFVLQKRFFPFFLTQCSGAFNDNLYKNLMVLLVTFNAQRYTTLDPALVANLAAGLFILPYVLFSAPAGQLADAMNKARIMRGVKIAEIGIMGLASAGFFLHSLPLLLGALFLMGVHSTVFGPVKYAVLPQVLSERELLGGNAWVEMGTFVSILLGTLAAGYMSTHGDQPELLSLSIVMTAVLGFVFSSAIPDTGEPKARPALSFHPGATRRLIRQTKNQTRVWHSVVAISWFWLMGSVLLAQLPAIVKDILQLGSNEVTGLLAAFSVSVGVGSLLCEKLLRGEVKLAIVPWAGAGISAFSIHLGLSNAQWAMLDLSLIGIFSGLFIVPLYTLIQKESPRDTTSSAIAANNIMNAFYMVGGAVATIGLLSVGLDALQVVAVSGVLNIVFLVWWVRRLG